MIENLTNYVVLDLTLPTVILLLMHIIGTRSLKEEVELEWK